MVFDRARKWAKMYETPTEKGISFTASEKGLM